jgi:hypothetical protein
VVPAAVTQQPAEFGASAPIFGADLINLERWVGFYGDYGLMLHSPKQTLTSSNHF